MNAVMAPNVQEPAITTVRMVLAEMLLPVRLAVRERPPVPEPIPAIHLAPASPTIMPTTLKLPAVMVPVRLAKEVPVVLPQPALTLEITAILPIPALTGFVVGPEPAV